MAGIDLTALRTERGPSTDRSAPSLCLNGFRSEITALEKSAAMHL
jgi:hypothetical protein